MPIYEYECQSCQKITEARQSISDAPLSTCDSCGGALSKIISQSSFQLKGGGWYADGYSNGKSKGCAAAGDCPAASSTPASPAPACGAACGC
ncbi:FmdB family zinc ribbon protein [Desulfurivibrio alkaliphilus]|uniref:Regulatory protein, FmdB family n=1 Tax=Desulfurivibrio alkaliphilus (strain DSM 19089 / UNIQEM U267 / AHT2) TaxID=589865 RepID=D6Z6L1_DESAT|nr:FmdB family zinc ribbon protein [Desulfurivibrio alkaliphilus]ADH84970.1 regulatory protein, FmdB family [Desulfurivibrio alkaliphilus AHT 2]